MIIILFIFEFVLLIQSSYSNCFNYGVAYDLEDMVKSGSAWETIGQNISDILGYAVSNGGDINGDGIGDIVLGAPQTFAETEGKAYVIFGTNSPYLSSSFNLASLDGTNGFVMIGEGQADEAGFAVSNSGDVNGDGIDDLIVGTQQFRDFTYVVFGGPNVGKNGTVKLGDLDGTNGYRIDSDESDAAGATVANGGDVNDDGIDDIILGAVNANPNTRFWSGTVYVLFGGKTVGSSGAVSLRTLDGSNGFRIDGDVLLGKLGLALDNSGDVNGDGIDDITITEARSGIYVIYGNSDFTFTKGRIDVSDIKGSVGYKIIGKNWGGLQFSGFGVFNGGDVNADGVADVIVGAYPASPNGMKEAGITYVVYGGKNVPTNGTFNVTSLNGENGFAIYGTAAQDFTGRIVSSATDLNNDGIHDIVIAEDVAINDTVGEIYFVFGSKATRKPVFELTSLNGTNGYSFVFDSGFVWGPAFSCGSDVSGDGIADCVVGIPSSYSYKGSAFIVYSCDEPLPTTTPTSAPSEPTSLPSSRPSAPTYMPSATPIYAPTSVPTSKSEPKSSNKNNDDDELTEGELAGIIIGVIGCVLLIILIVLVSYLIYLRSKDSLKNQDVEATRVG